MARQDGDMRLTKLGHACLHLTHGDGSVLIDPGTYSSGFEELRGRTAILITHQHPDLTRATRQ